MSLFTINRYMGDPVSAQASPKSDAKGIIDKLNAKAKERETKRKSPGNKKKRDAAALEAKLTKFSPANQSDKAVKDSGSLNQDDGSSKKGLSPGTGKKKKVGLGKDRKAVDSTSTSHVVERTDQISEDRLSGDAEIELGQSLNVDSPRKGRKQTEPAVQINKSPKKKSSKKLGTDSSVDIDDSPTKKSSKKKKSGESETEEVGVAAKRRLQSEDGEEDERKLTHKEKRKKQKLKDAESTEAEEATASPISRKKKAKGKRSLTKEDGSKRTDTQEEGVHVQEENDAETNELDDQNDIEEREIPSDDELQEEEEEEGTSFQVLGDFEKRSKKKVQETLPEWLAHPSIIERNLSESNVAVDSIKGLDSRIVQTLTSLGIVKFFPVQNHVIPVVLESLRYGMHTGEAGYRPRDLCVSAPTGSGKTLAYSIPIIQALVDRVVPRVRALIVLPTRDLATQVHKVVTSLCRNTPLRVVLVGGTRKFAQEQSQLVKEQNGEYQSLADVVIATPGRLVDNINHTPGFTLQYLRFLVIDEADRMMDQISQDWIAQVEKSAYPANTPISVNGLVRPSVDSVRHRPGPLTVARSSSHQLPLQKLLFSATLSQNPEKLTQLRLFRPRLITTATGSSNRDGRSLPGQGHGVTSVAGGHGEDDGMEVDGEMRAETGDGSNEFVGKYTTPVGLSEYFVQCTAGEKPLALMHLLTHLYFKQVLCFTNTVQSTHRLFLLLKLMGGVEAAEFSSNLQQSQRQAILKQFKAGKIQILVCSDAMARGMDIENVKCVISYDLPPHLKTYIHRVGRTARAGRAGTAFSLIRKKEVTKFKQMLRNAGKERIQRHQVSANQMESLIPSYTEALTQLPSLLKEEKAHQY